MWARSLHRMPRDRARVRRLLPVTRCTPRVPSRIAPMPKLSASGDPHPAPASAARRPWREVRVPALTAATLTLGYAALGRGSDTLAPVLLVLGYCVLVPLAILTTGRRGRDA